ncbi:MAG TPA: prepilin-type N-terminal cleavage/methylation domain-containing protein [Candidatus Acidoferrum sp.]|jgi:prepilin-type N-terminal cleavage/methylation domain-containing protein|nr:prepilin-type N-terminal cleavage/methylation domain-containing protein [Candidatus Acidoferrum sp.]
MRIRASKLLGFTLIEIMIVVALIGLLATIATPTWVRARTRSQANTCINNLRQIDAAKQQWGLDTKQTASAPVLYSDISGYLKNAVSCPTAGTDTSFSGSYTPQDLGSPPLCRISPENHTLPTEPSN